MGLQTSQRPAVKQRPAPHHGTPATEQHPAIHHSEIHRHTLLIP